MGRRKIEIKAIKDDRNRSVTFLKRKGGLFKKAHELAVLCSVDVAVIIFGHNKKLYEFSSGDMNEIVARYQYYGGPHEHKGPEDFMNKKDGDDDDDDDDQVPGVSPPQDMRTPPEQQMMPRHFQNQPHLQHMRHTTPSASPPMPSGPMPGPPVPLGLPYHHQRHPSPQPGPHSRPGSRAQVRRASSNLAPPQHHMSQPPPPPNNYAYIPPQVGAPFYNPHAAMPPNKPPQGQPAPPQPQPQYQYTHPPPPNSQMHPQQQQPQQQYMSQEPRRQSGPPVFQSQPPPQQQDRMTLPQPMRHSPPQQEPDDFQSPPLPQPKPLPAARQHSIFTPIDDSRSMLAAHFPSSSSMEPPRSEAPMKLESGPRSHSIDVAVMSRPNTNGNPPSQPMQTQSHQQMQNHTPQPPHSQPQSQNHPPPPLLPEPKRIQSNSSVPIIAPPIPPPSRTNSIQTDMRRPRLTVQIPDDQSQTGSGTGGSSTKDSGNGGLTAARTSTDLGHSPIILPPPSPSANSLLSAGAIGPPNPFARPLPPPNGMYGSRGGDVDTPVSALPSRFVENGLLPSPSAFYPDWGFGRESTMLPSPLPFQTPVVTNGPSFARDDAIDRKRKSPEGFSDAANGQKKVKTEQ